jgi:MYXO-CTERM domain-containing protein
MTRLGISIAAGVCAAVTAAPAAHAFCGFYINGAGGEMFNNATQVVLMRQGTRTVLSMQNNYQGPPQDFAMVIPVPVVLKESDVKTLTQEVFAKVDVMGAPRLVEYWEQDPCGSPAMPEGKLAMAAPMDESGGAMADKAKRDYGVTIEAKFTVGEYNIVILSAKESTGLDRYLRDQKYQIPKGAERLLRPYVEGGSKFFVAKVDPKKVRFENGQAQLSPLRFHYDSEEFALPIRLGLANAKDKQDLIVNILAPGQRYEVANYKNATIPTNLDVKDDVRKRFGEFYAALFDRTTERNPGAVITEYAWDASTCDPCPGPQLDESDFAVLGADVLGQGGDEDGYGGFVLTRLHARYGKDGAPNDLVFKAAPPIAGGREERSEQGRLEERAHPDDTNNFQGRYAIRHAWTGPVQCQDPVRGIWGGPPGGGDEIATQPATNLAFAPRGKVQLPDLVAQDVPEIDVKAGVPLPGGAGFHSKGCGCTSGDAGGLAGGGALAGLVIVLVRRRRRS